MKNLVDSPVLDKTLLIGTCVRLPVVIDAEKLVAEFQSIPANLWGSRAGRVGVHMQAEAIFLRGYAPADGDLPIEDRPPLASLPTFRSMIYDFFDAQPLRCLLAKLKPLGSIPQHIDKGIYFEKTIRIHVPIVTNQYAVMTVDGREHQMRVGEVWAINNCTVHGVENRHPAEARTHLICDFLPSEKLLGMLSSGKKEQPLAL